MPGVHNALNASAAVAVCSELGVSVEAITRGLSSFEGVGRRFSVLGNVNWDEGSALLVDDYGHHPTELRATINAAREAYPGSAWSWCFNHIASVAHATATTNLSTCYQRWMRWFYSMFTPRAKMRLSVPIAVHWREVSGRRASLIRVALDNGQLAARLSKFLVNDDVLIMQGAGNIGRLSKMLSETSSLEALV